MKKLLSLLFLFSVLPVHADYHPIEVKHGGSIHGLVKFSTESPPRGMFGTRGDPNCPAGIPQEQLLVKQENRGIKNVLVILDIDHGKPLKLSSTTLTMDGCRFVPRIQVAPKSTSLLLVNRDPTVHAVRALRRDVAAFKVDIPARQTARRPLVDLGLYKINDETHLWMRGWIYVTRQPYVAVTDAEGHFELTDIPPGTYVLRAWHEGWKEKGTEHSGQLMFQQMQQEQRVTVRADQTTEVQLDNLGPTFESFLGI